MAYVFTPPTVEEGPAGGQRPFDRFRIPRGITLLKMDPDVCEFIEVRWPTQDELDAAAVYYRGGYTYVISDEAGACLIAAGYGDFLEGPIGFGLGGYGIGPYGARVYGT